MNHSLRQAYLDAIGIQNWHLKSVAQDTVDDAQLRSKPESSDDHSHFDIAENIPDIIFEPESKNVVPPPDKIESVSAMNPVEQQSTKELESEAQADISEAIELHQENKAQKQQKEHEDQEAESTIVAKAPIVTPSVSVNTEMDSELLQSIQSCQRCPTRARRLNALVGQGNIDASILIICDAPNAEEDRAGHYLTGATETLFQAMLKSVDLGNDYFLTGIIKCHSLENFLVEASELINCADFLSAQLKQIKPDLVVVFGAAQAQAVLTTSASFNELRGKVHKVTLNHTEYPLVATYHPAYLLRNPLYKKQALADLLMIKTTLK